MREVSVVVSTTKQLDNTALQWSARIASVCFILLLRTTNGTYVNNLLKNYDTQDYVWLDCNGGFFETLFFSNENITVYTNMCRSIPAHIYKLEDLPSSVDPKEANIFIKRRAGKTFQYTFLSLASNNGISTPSYSKGPGAEYYWRSDDPAVDFSLKLYPGEHFVSKSGIDLTVQDEYKMGSTARQNLLYETNLKVTYNHSIAATKANSVSTTLIGFSGIFRHSDVSIAVRGSILLLVVFLAGLPYQKTLVKSRYSLFTWSLYFLSLNLVTEICIQFFGERVPSTNLVLWVLLPAIGASLMQARKIGDRIDTRTNSRWLFYFCAAVNFFLFAIFVVSVNHKNKSTFSGVFAGLFLPVAIYLVLFCLSHKPQRLAYLTLRYILGVFGALRLFQIVESPKGSLKRIFEEPLRGKFYENIQFFVWMVPIVGAVYSYCFFALVAKDKGAEDEYGLLRHGIAAAGQGSYLAETDEMQNNSETKF